MKIKINIIEKDNNDNHENSNPMEGLQISTKYPIV